mmetsp:Transcript_64100/g.171546  ORF Transcript_64100/g.171546 Transcript_64100/m.171546 type:complete len:289 (-) Transcript_64100:1879-2745(-)
MVTPLLRVIPMNFTMRGHSSVRLARDASSITMEVSRWGVATAGDRRQATQDIFPAKTCRDLQGGCSSGASVGSIGGDNTFPKVTSNEKRYLELTASILSNAPTLSNACSSTGYMPSKVRIAKGCASTTSRAPTSSERACGCWTMALVPAKLFTTTISTRHTAATTPESKCRRNAASSWATAISMRSSAPTPRSETTSTSGGSPPSTSLSDRRTAIAAQAFSTTATTPRWAPRPVTTASKPPTASTPRLAMILRDPRRPSASGPSTWISTFCGKFSIASTTTGVNTSCC